MQALGRWALLGSAWIGTSVERTVGEAAKRGLQLERAGVPVFVNVSDQCKTSEHPVGSSNKVKLDQTTIYGSYA